VLAVLSLNTALDRTEVVPGFTSGMVFRATRSSVQAGGKGLNVARVLRRLGAAVRVIGFLGGPPALPITQACRDLGIDTCWIPTANESRTCIIITDPESGLQTVVNEPGPPVSPEDVDAIRAAVLEHVGEGDVLAIAGSAPPGVPAEFYRDLVTELQRCRVRFLVDVAGDSLRPALTAQPWAVAPNLSEAQSALEERIGDREAIKSLSMHADHAILTLGAQGVLYAHRGMLLRMSPPEVPSVNAVGSGDALVAGFLAGIERGMDSADALRLGIACGASNAMMLEADIGPLDEIERLAAAVITEAF
jgi:tagatose 6-phosphate kinase